MTLTKIGASLGSSADTILVTQSNSIAVGRPVRIDRGTDLYAYANSTTPELAEAVGIVIERTNATMLIALSGRVTVNACLPNGATPGTVLYLNSSNDTTLVTSAPTTAGYVVKPMAVVTVTNSEMLLINYRGEVNSVGAASIADGSVDNDAMADDAINTDEIVNNAVTLAKMAHGTDGNLITYDTSGAPAYVATGNDGQVLTSAGANNPPAFETLSTGLTSKIGYFQWDSANSAGSQAVTGLGFQPSLIIFDSNIHNDKFHSLGMAATNVVSGSANNTTTFEQTAGGSTTTSTATRVAIWDRSPASADTYQSNIDRVIFGWTGNSTGTWVQGDISSYDSDGFTIAWTKSGSPSGTVNINYAAFK